MQLIGAFLLLIFVFFITALCIQFGYNASIPHIFPGLITGGFLVKTVTFGQACGVVVLMAGLRGGMGREVSKSSNK